MKKITSIALATCVVGSAFMFAGCNGGGSVNGAVKGNYEEITAENQAQAVQELNAFETATMQSGGGLMGDMTAENWKFGVSFSTALNVDYNLEGMANGKMGVNGNLTVAMENKNNAMDVKGKGEFSVTMKGTTVDEEESSVTDLKLTANAYAVDGYAYGDLSMTGQMDNEAIPAEMQALAGKASFRALGTAFEGVMEDFPMGDIGDIGGNIGESVTTLGESVVMLKEMGIPVSYELSQKTGLKLKISFTKDFFEAFMNDMASEEVSFAMSTETPMVTFDTCKLDAYLVISEKGELKQISMDMDVNAKMADATNSGKSYMKVKGGVVFKADSKISVSVPENIKTDTKYVDYSLMLGMGGIF